MDLLSGAISGLGGLTSYYGQRHTNATNLKIAREQMDFQERMSGTAHQRAVQDMLNAGINPYLASTRSAASTPTGAAPTMENALGKASSSALELARTRADLKLTKAQIAATRAQAENIAAQTKLTDINAAFRPTDRIIENISKLIPFAGGK